MSSHPDVGRAALITSSWCRMPLIPLTTPDEHQVIDDKIRLARAWLTQRGILQPKAVYCVRQTEE